MSLAAARLAIAAAAIAAAFWLIPSSVHIVAWPASGPVRVALLPPLRQLLVAILPTAAMLGALVAILRRRGASWPDSSRTLAPLGLLLLWVVPFLPWLPDRAPVLLVLAGPLRWVVAAVAVLGVFRDPFRRVWRAPSAVPGVAIFAVSLAIYATVGVHYAREVGFGGDEPHYLIITHSLLADRDLDIANNHAQRDYRSFFASELRPDFLQRGVHGEVYSIHAPGLPALLLPAYAIGGAVGAVVFIAILSALTAWIVYRTAMTATDPGTALAVWAATCLTIPFLPHAWLIYPELPGALIVAVAVWRLWRPVGSIAGAAAYGALLATLPWLHTKFALLLALFAAFEAVRLWPWTRWRQLIAFAAPIGISGVAWLYSFYRMYGVVDPEAPYGAYTRMFVLSKNIPRGTLGLLFDQKFGLMAYSPIYAAAAIGFWLMLRDRTLRFRAAALLLTALAFFVSTTRLYMWWGGSSAPARFMVPLLPLLAMPLAIAIARSKSTAVRAAIGVSLLVSLAIAAVTIGSSDQELLYSEPHGFAALVQSLQGSAPLDASLPTFTEENWRAPIALLIPWLVAAALSAAIVAAAARRRWVSSAFWTATTGAVLVLATGSFAAGLREPPSRQGLAVRGQLSLMKAYDPSRLHAVDITHARRLTPDQALAAAALTIRRPADAPSDNPHVLEGPFQLPEGRYEARVWFDGPRPPSSEAFVALSEQIRLIEAINPESNPAVMPFDLKVDTPAFVGVNDQATARLARRVDIAPVAVVPRSARAAPSSHVVEPIGGTHFGYIAYLDDETYPEGGVFWTRDTGEGRVAIVTGEAKTLRLVLHVGPTGGPVTVDAGNGVMNVDLHADETREVTIPVPPGAGRMVVGIRAARAFRPSAVDPASSDDRRLGCQVRPLL